MLLTSFDAWNIDSKDVTGAPQKLVGEIYRDEGHTELQLRRTPDWGGNLQAEHLN